jgi:hypothetical protein
MTVVFKSKLSYMIAAIRCACSANTTWAELCKLMLKQILLMSPHA